MYSGKTWIVAASLKFYQNKQSISSFWVVFQGSEVKNPPMFFWHYFNDSIKKNFEQRFVVFWSVLTKLWSYKVLIRREWRHTRECTKHFISVLLYLFSLILWNRTFHTILWSFWPTLINLWSCNILNNQIGSRHTWRHTREYAYIMC